MSYVMDCVEFFFFVNATATTEIYTYRHTLSLHDALPICVIFRLPDPEELPPPLIGLDHLTAGYVPEKPILRHLDLRIDMEDRIAMLGANGNGKRSEEHTSELQSLMRISYAVF